MNSFRGSARVIGLGAVPTGLAGMTLDAFGLHSHAVVILTIAIGFVVVHVLEADRRSTTERLGLSVALSIMGWLERTVLGYYTYLLSLRLVGLGDLKIGQEFYVPKDGVACLTTVEYLHTGDGREAWLHFTLRSIKKTIIVPATGVREEGIRALLSPDHMLRLLARGARSRALDNYFLTEVWRQSQFAGRDIPSLDLWARDPEAVLAALTVYRRLTEEADAHPNIKRPYQEERIEELFSSLVEEISHVLHIPREDASNRLQAAIDLLSSRLKDRGIAA